MLGWALTFLILALVAGYMGFFGLAGLAATIAKLLLIVFLILLVVSAFSGALRAGRLFEPLLTIDFEGNPKMRIPGFLIEHPLEALVAGILLLALLFGPSDRHAAEMAVQPHAKVAAMDRM